MVRLIEISYDICNGKLSLYLSGNYVWAVVLYEFERMIRELCLSELNKKINIFVIIVQMVPLNHQFHFQYSSGLPTPIPPK